MEFDNLLAARMAILENNAIREILKVVSRPGMISLAGGIPAPESFPLDILQELIPAVLKRYGSRALQYDLTEGFQPLRAALADFLGQQRGIAASADDVLIASGSQGLLDALGKILISKGDRIAVESPTYLGALQAFNPYEPEYISLPTDDDGLIPEALEQMLARTRVKFVYLVPTFQNPTGRTLSLDRRCAIARILVKHDTLLVEDDPYCALRYRGRVLDPIQTLAPHNVVYISTLSKVLAPGLRLGFCVAPPPLSDWLVRVKQGVDLHTSTFSQALAAEYLSAGLMEKHLPRILDLYRPRQAAMLQAFEAYFPDNIRWTRPDGGMFIWAQGPPGLDMEKVYWRAVDRGVAFVPGKFFFAHPNEGLETMRLNFTMVGPSALDAALKTLAGVVRAEMQAV